MSLTEPGTRKCPYCAEEIKVEAIFCKHCRRRVAARFSAGSRALGLAAATLLLAAIGIAAFLARRTAGPSVLSPAKGAVASSGAAAPARGTALPPLDSRMGEWAEEYRSNAGTLAASVRALAGSDTGGGTDSCTSLQRAVAAAKAGIPVAPDSDIKELVGLGLQNAETAVKWCLAGGRVKAKATLVGTCFKIAENTLKVRYNETGVGGGWPYFEGMTLPTDILAAAASAVPASPAAVPVAPEPSGSDYSAAEQTIRSHCTKEWPTDYHMQAYCIDQQHQALATLLSGRPAEVPEAEFARMREHCASEWPDDFHMRVYCEKQQADGYRKIN
jgi:hypothetical protein